MEITVRHRHAQRSAAVLHVGPYHEIGAAFDRLGAWIGTHVADVAGPPLGVYPGHPEGTPPQEWRGYAAVPVTAGADLPSGGLEALEIAGGRYAEAVHHGSYAGLPEAWQSAMTALLDAGLVADISRPCLEVYQSDPRMVAEEDLVTVLLMPIE
jgi:AraC family transcriptional regulator